MDDSKLTASNDGETIQNLDDSLDLEAESLISLEKLDRLSPDLWTDQQFTGMYDLASLANSPLGKIPSPNTISEQDHSLLCQFGSLSPDELIEEIRKLLNVAYQLGIEEARQMTKGKYMEVLTTPKDEDDA